MPVTFIKSSSDGTLFTKTVSSEFNAKLYPLVCDGITLTCDFPENIQKSIITCFKQEGAKPKTGYKLSGTIKDVPMKTAPYLPDEEGEIAGAFIQCAPFDSGNRFLRIDFNPARLHVDVLKLFINNNWLTHPDFGFDYVLANGRVNRIDLAADIASEQVEELFYYYPKIQHTEVHTKSGRTLYLGGKSKTKKLVAIYDRLPAIKAHNAKKYYDPKQQLPEPVEDIMRVEVRLFPKMLFKDLLNIKNPFAPLTVSSCSVKEEDDTLWRLFLALARFEGSQATLGRLPKHLKSEYVKRLKQGQVSWWKPEHIWEQFPAVIEQIADPVAQTSNPYILS